ncbi:MAG TPA: 4Fe-4S dicluster domain-containing protein [Pyrinomonadaceae bacterium]|nr:4Fe-4S dicluster domain-containing protein [Pyrinomonadaceae bacterium]
MSNQQKRWKQFLAAENDGEQLEYSAKSPIAGVSRRTFLEVLGYSTVAVTLTGCRAPEQKIVPYLREPVEFTPGVASWFASTCGGCSAACGTLVKVRDGRPIKLEGNPDHPLSEGGLCAVAHGMIFGLYDPDRLRSPMRGSQPATWEEIDDEILGKLSAIKKSGGKVRILTAPLSSPASRKTIQTFLAQFTDGKHITYQPVSNDAIRQAHLRSHGIAAIPQYRLEKAKLVVSFGADFLGTWIMPVQFTRGYAKTRSLTEGRREILRHVQFESIMSLTGSNADKRIRVSPHEKTQALLYLARLIAPSTDLLNAYEPRQLSVQTQEAVEELSRELLSAQGESLIVSGSNAPDSQYLTNFINDQLGNYGKTIELTPTLGREQSSDAEMVELVQQMNTGEIAALIVCGVNPVYDYFESQKFVDALKAVPLRVSLNSALDETSSLADYVCPQNHFLESWDDAEAVQGTLGINQPTIAPLFQTRAFQETLMRWSGDQRSFYEVLRNTWREEHFPQQNQFATFEGFWDATLQKGVFSLQQPANVSITFKPDTLSGAIGRLQSTSGVNSANELDLVLYQTTSLRDGRFANNPWLQELPDPLTKITWDNYACVSQRYAAMNGLEEGRVVRISNGAATIELPVHIQPGQHDDVVAIALGYGRSKAGKAGSGIGANAFPFVAFVDGSFRYSHLRVTLVPTASKVEFAQTQIKDSQEGRRLARELTLTEYVKGTESHHEEHASLWSPHDYPEHKWGIAVDLNACVGCNACVISCQAENNIPVVGKDEVRRSRDMHWLRVDRYFEGDRDNLRVNYQPLMCAQCDNASCESVCPVLATVHSSEGLNMQVYNRCVGTRYCENNCPYKVRRFNWFTYARDDAVANLALNPDVTVRSRGVMEKCTFCVQRIEEAKINARNEGRPINDGEIQPACQQSCPSQAIIFGDLRDVKSRVAQMKKSGRNYTLLDELNLRPAVSYLAKVRN